MDVWAYSGNNVQIHIHNWSQKHTYAYCEECVGVHTFSLRILLYKYKCLYRTWCVYASGPLAGSVVTNQQGVAALCDIAGLISRTAHILWKVEQAKEFKNWLFTCQKALRKWIFIMWNLICHRCKVLVVWAIFFINNWANFLNNWYSERHSKSKRILVLV